MGPDDLIALLGLKPHPEGGHFKESFRDAGSTAIYFLLRRGERSHWHKVDAAEGWHFYAGAPLELEVSADGQNVERVTLGVDFAAGQRPQFIVPKDAWQAARTLGDFTLVGCTVAPPFRFEGFTLAAPGWQPGQ